MLNTFKLDLAFPRVEDDKTHLRATVYAPTYIRAKQLARERWPNMFIYTYCQAGGSTRLNLTDGPWIEVPIAIQTGLMLEFSCSHLFGLSTRDQEEEGLPSDLYDFDDSHITSTRSLHMLGDIQFDAGISVVKLADSRWLAYIADENGQRHHNQVAMDPVSAVIRSFLTSAGGTTAMPLSLMWFERDRLRRRAAAFDI